MSIIQASFPENIYFSSQKNHTELCDFVFSIHINANLKDEKDKDQSEENSPIVYIGGLSKLFPTVEENPENQIPKFKTRLENFIDDLRVIGNDNNWSINYNDEHDLLELKCKTEHSFTDKYTVGFELSQECEFSKELENNEPIPLDVTFINFDSIFDGLANETVASYTIYAKEVPYVEEFYACLGSEGKKVKTVPKGEWVKITWSVRNAPKASAFLCDESGTVICDKEEKPVMSPYNVQINEDRRFKLFVEKDGRRASQILTVNQISPVDVAVFNSHGEQTQIVHNMAKITWSGGNIEKCKISLCDENENVVAKESPYKLIVSENRKFKLKLEREDCVVSQEFWIYRTAWTCKGNIQSLDLCDVGTKGDNRFWGILYQCFFYYVDKLDETIPHIKQYDSQPRKYTNFDSPPDSNKVKHYSTYCTASASSNHRGGCTEVFGICYTLHDNIEIRDYLINGGVFFFKQSIDIQELKKDADKDNDGEFLFCQEGGVSRDDLNLFAVYQHAVHVYSRVCRKDRDLVSMHYLKKIIPPVNANIISIDSCEDFNEIYLAILCDNNYIYLYDCVNLTHASDLCFSYSFDKINNPQRVYLFNLYIKRTFVIVVNGYVFLYDGRRYNIQKKSHDFFSPKDTIIDKQNGFMYIGTDEDFNLIAIVRDNNIDTLWQFNPDKS